MSAPKPCAELTCHGLLAFLRNAETGRLVPADWDTLSTEEKEHYEAGREICFIPEKHVSHYKTCKNPNRFTRRR